MKEHLVWVILPLDIQEKEITTETIHSQLEKYNFGKNKVERYEITIEDTPEADNWFNPVGKYDFYMLLTNTYEEGDIYLETTNGVTPLPVITYCLELFHLFSSHDAWKVYKRLPSAIITPSVDWIELYSFEDLRKLGGWDSTVPEWCLEARLILFEIIKHVLVVLDNYKSHVAVRVRYV